MKCKYKNCEYIPKKNVKEYRKVMEDVIKKVKTNIKAEYVKSCNSSLVGSAKRNLVVQKGLSHWDVDYQFIFSSPKFDDEKKIYPPDLKVFIQNSLKSHLGDNYSVKMSTSVITICLKDDEESHAIKSFDLALIRKSDGKILKGYKNDKSSQHYIKWDNITNSIANKDDVKKIRGSKMWNTLRCIFIKKKCENMNKEKDDQIPTYSLYWQSIKETLDKY